jgi:hypothetical protein
LAKQAMELSGIKQAAEAEKDFRGSADCRTNKLSVKCRGCCC